MRNDARGELAHADVSPRVASLSVDLLRYEALKASQKVPLEIPGQNAGKSIVDDIFLPLVHAVAGLPADPTSGQE